MYKYNTKVLYLNLYNKIIIQILLNNNNNLYILKFINFININ